MSARAVPRTSTTRLGQPPGFMDHWRVAYPRPRGHWTVAGPGGVWGELDPEAGTHHIVDPSHDPVLPAMPAALRRGNLIGYRAGRRAIIATPDTFIKVVRPGRLEQLLDAHRSLAALCPALSFPRVLRSDRTGWVELAAVPGRSLHDLLRSADPNSTVSGALDDTGPALAALHSTPTPRALASSGIDTPRRWIDIVRRVEPGAGPELDRAARHLPILPPTRLTVVHGDLHDKNIFASTNGVALIDLDGAGLGAAEDDVANLGVHLQLRSLQAGHPDSVGNEHAERLYSAYRSVRVLDPIRLDAVRRHTWFRLACLYRFRVTGRRLVPELLRRASGRQR